MHSPSKLVGAGAGLLVSAEGNPELLDSPESSLLSGPKEEVVCSDDERLQNFYARASVVETKG